MPVSIMAEVTEVVDVEVLGSAAGSLLDFAIDRGRELEVCRHGGQTHRALIAAGEDAEAVDDAVADVVFVADDAMSPEVIVVDCAPAALGFS